jgi:RNA polymerase sigma-70 factor (ECF subfamily)
MNHRPHSEVPQDAPLESYHAGLYRYLLRRLKGAPDAEDLAQTIYLRFLQAPNVTAIRQPQAYLYRIAANAVSEYIMRRKAERITFNSHLADELAEHSADPQADEAAEQLESQQLFKQVLTELPTTHRAVLVLYAQEGLTPEEIGAKLGVNTHTVRKYLRQALARFRATDWSHA